MKKNTINSIYVIVKDEMSIHKISCSPETACIIMPWGIVMLKQMQQKFNFIVELKYEINIK